MKAECEPDCSWIDQSFDISNQNQTTYQEWLPQDFSHENNQTIFKYSCFEKDPFWGGFTCSFIFLPGIAFSLILAYTIKKTHGSKAFLLHLILPFYPFILFFVKVISLFQHGKEWKRFSAFVTACESQVESLLQAVLQLYIIWSRPERQASASQQMAFIGSWVMIGYGLVKALFANRSPGESYFKTVCQLVFTSLMYGIVVFVIVFGLVMLININKMIFFTSFGIVISLFAIYFCITRVKTSCQPQVSAKKLILMMINIVLLIGLSAGIFACLIIAFSTFNIIPSINSLNLYWTQEWKISIMISTGVASFGLLLTCISTCCKAYK